MKTIILYSYLILALSSCDSQSFYGDKDLGNGYFLWYAGSYVGLVYDDGEKPSGENALPVLRESIEKYCFNDTAIVVVILDSVSTSNYWLIDKTTFIDMNQCHDQVTCDKLIRSNMSGPYSQNPLVCNLEKTKSK